MEDEKISIGMPLEEIVENYDEKGDPTVNSIHKNLWDSFRWKPRPPVYIEIPPIIQELLGLKTFSYLPIDPKYIDERKGDGNCADFSMEFIEKLRKLGYKAWILNTYPPIATLKVFSGSIIPKDSLDWENQDWNGEIIIYASPVLVYHSVVLVKLPNGKYALYDSRRMEKDKGYAGKPIPLEVLKKAIRLRDKTFCYMIT